MTEKQSTATAHPPVRLDPITYGVIKMRIGKSGRSMGGEIKELLAIVTKIEQGHEENAAVVIMTKEGDNTKISAPLQIKDVTNGTN